MTHEHGDSKQAKQHLRAPMAVTDPLIYRLYNMRHKHMQLTTRCRTLGTLILALIMLQNNQLWPAQTVWCRPSVEAPQDDSGLSGGQRGILRTLSPPREQAECAVFAEYGRNYLTPVDLVVKHSETNKVCIRAQFALSIRVEEAHTMGPAPENERPHETHEHVHRPILGYVPLEHELRVEESCPDSFTKKPDLDKDGGAEVPAITKHDDEPTVGEQSKTKSPINASTNTTTTESQSSNENPHTRATREAKSEDENNLEDNELELIVTFDCGKLSFTFTRDKSRIYVSAIRGIVKLDKKNVREFIAIRPMFLTSDLDHHFKYSDEIEVVSEAQSGKHILTALFYDTEFEAFRNTTSRDFVKPPDGKSKPFPDENDIFESQEKTS